MKGALLRKIVVSLLIGGVCLWLALKKVDLSEVGAALKGFDPFYLFLAVGISLLIQVFRAWRWQIELSPLAHIPFTLTWRVVAIAYMMINVLPSRLGEPVRPVLMSWKSGLTVPALVGNWVFEKMMDSAALVLFIHITLVIADCPPWAHKASTFSLATFVALLAAITGFWLKGEVFFRATLGRVLPTHLAAKVHKVLVGARDGLQILPDKRLVAFVFLVTLVLWSLPILSSYVLILGFGFDVPVAAAFVVFVCIGLGTAVPGPPGMFGVIQVACVVALGLFGVPKAEALAYGIVLNSVQFLTLIAQGLFALPFSDVGLGKLTRAAVEQAPQTDCA